MKCQSSRPDAKRNEHVARGEVGKQLSVAKTLGFGLGHGNTAIALGQRGVGGADRIRPRPAQKDCRKTVNEWSIANKE